MWLDGERVLHTVALPDPTERMTGELCRGLVPCSSPSASACDVSDAIEWVLERWRLDVTLALEGYIDGARNCRYIASADARNGADSVALRLVDDGVPPLERRP